MRLIRPLNVARLLALMLAFSTFVPSSSVEAATTRKKSSTSTSKSKPTYSAAASQARKARLARAPEDPPSP